jgi:hypothetical protein
LALQTNIVVAYTLRGVDSLFDKSRPTTIIEPCNTWRRSGAPTSICEARSRPVVSGIERDFSRRRGHEALRDGE